MAGYRRIAVAQIAGALLELTREIETTVPREIRRQHQYAREALAFFDPRDPLFCLWCAHLGVEPETLADFIRENYDSPEFRARIQREAVLPVLFFGADARPTADESGRSSDSEFLGIHETTEETAWSTSTSTSPRNGTRAAIEWGID
jgi:hypothetical protein